jgi:hypothetical protein
MLMQASPLQGDEDTFTGSLRARLQARELSPTDLKASQSNDKAQRLPRNSIGAKRNSLSKREQAEPKRSATPHNVPTERLARFSPIRHHTGTR